MESEARYAWVGGTIIILIVTLAMALLWLQGALDHREFQRYTVYFRQHSLDGLQLNSDVKMYGIKVGKVVDFEILSTEAKNVRVVVELDAKAPVLEGAEATVSRNLVTGLAYIEVENRREGAVPLNGTPKGERYPVIQEGPPRLARIAANLEQLAEQGNETLQRFNQALSDQNQQALSESLSGLATFSASLARRAPEIEAAIVASHAAMQELHGLSTAARQTLERSDARLERLGSKAEIVLDETREAVQAMRQDVHDTTAELRLATELGLQELQRTGRTLKQAGDNVGDAAIAVRGATDAVITPGKANLGPGE